MRNPIRVKNLRLRFAPFYLLGGLLLVCVPPSPVGYGIGVVAVATGAALRAWGAGHLEKTTRLTVSGPYARLRHPLYLGTLLAGLGIAIMVGGWWALGLAGLFVPWFFLDYFPRKERSESARLLQAHGEAYRCYLESVPALAPRLTAWQPEASRVADFDLARRWSLERYLENNELGTLLALLACIAAFGVRLGVAVGGS